MLIFVIPLGYLVFLKTWAKAVQVKLFPALLVICSVVEPTLKKRDLPLASDGKSKDLPDAEMRVPPISIGLTCPADTAGWGNVLCYDERREGRSSFYYIDAVGP